MSFFSKYDRDVTVERSVHTEPPISDTFSPAGRRIRSLFGFMLRYPIFLLAFGPPVLRTGKVGTDTSQAHADVWSVLQVAWIGAVTANALYRLRSKILIPPRIQLIIRTGLLLGLLFAISVLYSPGRTISAEFAMIYFMTWAVIVQFVSDSYTNSIDWTVALRALRAVCLSSYILILVVLVVSPGMVFTTENGQTLRLTGGAVGSTVILGPVIEFLSLYFLLHKIDKPKKGSFFVVFGVIGTLASASRGAIIATLLIMAVIAFVWASDSSARRLRLTTSLLVMSAIAIVVVIVIGGDKLWTVFNRGESTADIEQASGRTYLWRIVLSLVANKPQGLGYVAGFRSAMVSRFDIYFNGDITHLGSAHNTFLQYLLDGGWLGLLCFIIMTVQLGLLVHHFIRKRSVRKASAPAYHALCCGAAIELYCLINGVESSAYNIPLQQSFYLQHIAYALMLGGAASLMRDYRKRQTIPVLLRIKHESNVLHDEPGVRKEPFLPDDRNS